MAILTLQMNEHGQLQQIHCRTVISHTVVLLFMEKNSLRIDN